MSKGKGGEAGVKYLEAKEFCLRPTLPAILHIFLIFPKCRRGRLPAVPLPLILPPWLELNQVQRVTVTNTGWR